MNRVWMISVPLAPCVLFACGGDAPADVVELAPDGAACIPGELTLSDGRCQPAGLPPDMACPPGWRVSPEGGCQPAGIPAEACAAGNSLPDGLGGCEPILPEQICPSGQMAVPGEKGCRVVSLCGDGPWNAAIPEDATTEHVDSSYPGSDSDGSRRRPWKTVGEGVQAAAPGAIVAVAGGRYVEDVLIVDKPVRLWGRCPARTVVVGLGAEPGAITISRGGASGTEVRGLAVTGPSAGVVVRGARSVALEEVWIHEAGLAGVSALELADVSLRGALLERNHGAGVSAVGSALVMDATVVRSTQQGSDGKGGRGIVVRRDRARGQRGRLLLTRSLVEQNRDIGVYAEGSEAAIDATVVRLTQRNGAGAVGWGVHFESSLDSGDGGELLLTRSLVEQNQEMGVSVLGLSATIEATVVRATRPASGGKRGLGINIRADLATGKRGSLRVKDSLIEQNRSIGLLVGGVDATVEATVVRATQPDTGGRLGQGIKLEPNPETREGATLVLKDSIIEQNHDTGVFVMGSEAAIERTVVRATQPNGNGAFGRGVNVQANPETASRAKLRITDSLIEQNHEVGVFAASSDAAIERTVVRATQPNGAGLRGRGINVEEHPELGWRSTLALHGVLVEENHDVGVLIVGGTEASIAATRVRATSAAPAGVKFGDGIIVGDEAGSCAVTLDRTDSSENTRVGVLYVGSTGTLSGVRSSRNRFGLVLQPGMSGALPTLGQDNTIEGNTERDEFFGGDLPIPDAALPVP